MREIRGEHKIRCFRLTGNAKLTLAEQALVSARENIFYYAQGILIGKYRYLDDQFVAAKRKVKQATELLKTIEP